MENLLEMIEKVKEEKLSKDLLESYHTSITYLDNLYRMELAPLEKEEALYFQDNKKSLAKGVDEEGIQWEKTLRVRTDIEIKRMWKATPYGQRQIELSHMLKVTPKLLQSLKTRLYSSYD